MKEFIEKHNSIIDYTFVPISKDAKEGDETLHKASASWISFFQQIPSEHGDTYQKIGMSREMIMDLAEHIKRIEAKELMLPVDTLPF